MEAPTTPPSSTSRFERARTPPSPTHGPMHDVYEPYSPRRSSRNVGNPYSTHNLTSKSASNHIPPLQTSKKPVLAFTPAELFPRSPPSSPKPVSGNKTSLLKTPHRSDSKTSTGLLDPSSSARKQISMLPTPSKTPTTTPARKHNRAISVENTARILHFQPEDPNDVMPPRRNRYKQKSIRATTIHGLDLDGDDFSEPDNNANLSFEVYAESHARVPKMDESEDNPFYRSGAAAAPAVRTSPRRSRKTSEQQAEEQEMDKAVARDEGMVYMFRGKKVYRKFSDSNSDSEAEVRDLDSSASQRALKRSVGHTAARPITRSSIQPRLLFPAASRSDDNIDEEAETDVEMLDMSVESHQEQIGDSVAFSVPTTPARTKVHALQMSPPTTSRASRKRNAEDAPVPLDDAPEPTPAKSAATLPTPQRSSKKKKVDINPIPTFQGEPTPAEGDASNQLTPQRSSRKKKPTTQLTPIVEHRPEASSSSGCSSSVASTSRRHSKSPFDSWPRTKTREADSPQSDSRGGGSKRARSAAI